VLCIRRADDDPKKPRKVIFPEAADAMLPGDRLIVFGESKKIDAFS
jgi:Trk K+ transport system NAD-binding subunit